jgi:hypothetical protein
MIGRQARPCMNLFVIGVVPQGLDVLFSFVLFGDFRSLFLGIFLGAISRPFSLRFDGGCMHESFVVLFPLNPLPNP